MDQTCESCQHFRRHYVRMGRNYYVPIDDGHCVRPRTRRKNAKDKICERYKARP